jgi:hypothetical protein
VLTAPSGGTPSAKVGKSAAPTASSEVPTLRPAPAAVPWAVSRSPGTAHFVVLRQADRAALRAAFWAAYKGGQAGTVEPNVQFSSVTIPTGVVYGAVEGPDAASDQFWAIGRVTLGTAQAPPNPHVWKRVGSGAWQQVGQGPAACDQVPQAIYTKLGTTSASCRAQT